MSDKRPSRRRRDRNRRSGGEAYAVSYFARKHGISQDRAERIIQASGRQPQTSRCALRPNRKALPGSLTALRDEAFRPLLSTLRLRNAVAV